MRESPAPLNILTPTPALDPLQVPLNSPILFQFNLYLLAIDVMAIDDSPARQAPGTHQNATKSFAPSMRILSDSKILFDRGQELQLP